MMERLLKVADIRLRREQSLLPNSPTDLIENSQNPISSHRSLYDFDNMDSDETEKNSLEIIFNW